MSGSPLLSDVVANKAREVGAGGWLDGLPALLEDLVADWGLTVGVPFFGGTEAYVASVETSGGEPAVLKLMIPRAVGTAAANEITVLQLAEGEGCPLLFRHDAARGAMLMERLGPSLFDLAWPIERRLPVLCDAAAAVWRPAPDCRLMTGADKGRWLIAFITRLWAELDHPCSEGAVAEAIACAERRIAAHDDERSVLVHGDVHQWNALQANAGFKLVDPDGLLAEAEYDLGILMREDPIELMAGGAPRDRAHWLAARTGLDATAIWEWGVVERVSTGLLATSIDLQPVGRHMLQAADAISAPT